MQRPALTPTTHRNTKPEDKPYELRSRVVPGLVLRVRPTGHTAYYARVGHTKRIKLGDAKILTLEQAQNKARDCIADPAAFEKARRQVDSLEEFIDQQYEPWAKAHNRTAKSDVNRVKRGFGAFMPKPLSEVTHAGIERWRATRINSGTARATVNRDVATLTGVLSRAVEWGVIDEHPLKKLKQMKVDNAKVRFLSTAEERVLRAALKARDDRLRKKRVNGNAPMGRYGDHLTPLVLLSLNTGMRQGEVFSLAWADVDLPNKRLTVQSHNAKSGKRRVISLNSEALQVLKGIQPKTAIGLVFPNKDGKRLTDIKTAWVPLLASTGIKDYRWHDHRHTFASKLVMVGVDLNTVRDFLGHADMKMTLRYAHLAPEHKAEAIERIVWK